MAANPARRFEWCCRAFGFVGLLLLVIPARLARGHDETVSTSQVEIADRSIVWKVDVGIAGLEKVVELSASESTLTAADLQRAAPAIGSYLQGGIELVVNGRTLSPVRGPLEPRYEPSATAERTLSRAMQTFRFSSTDEIRDVIARIDFFGDITSQHRSIVRVRWDDVARQFVRLGKTELRLSHAALFPSAWQVAGEFGRWGVHHIFLGYDHIAFLLAILLAVTGLRGLVITVSAFTVAHSFTLLLAALGIVEIPGRLTEVLIAGSIVYVAAENVTRGPRTAQQRWLLTFSFGLIHGLGFANELRNRLAELDGGVLWPVVSFNLGVEAGQLAIVALVFPLLAWARRAADPSRAQIRQQHLVRWGSVPILLLGLFWLIERMSG